MVDATPTSLIQNGVEDNSWVVPVNSTTPYNIIRIQWSPDPSISGGNPASDCPTTLDTFSPASGAERGHAAYVRQDGFAPTSGALTGGTGAGQLSQQAAYFIF